ncbi:MAG TPA: murein L,D-transpeptidase catalytic domain family protein [Thermoanaerobaculia bacterium]|nr:murein L,D-transpeptidase catalytic domain family protein [Thermoanaerobaculia bacterium]
MLKKLMVAAAMLCAVSAFAAPQKTLVQKLLSEAPGLHPQALEQALDAAHRASERGQLRRSDLLTVIDYSIRSSEPRLFVFDLKAGKLLFRELCAHGKNSGGDVAKFFSNDPGSDETSLGLFVTEDTYIGHNGYSLRLRGLSPGLNDMAEARAIVMHGAYYVSREAIKVLGRLGRSWGCPAVRADVAHKLIDTIRGGTAIFAYYPHA